MIKKADKFVELFDLAKFLFILLLPLLLILLFSTLIAIRVEFFNNSVNKLFKYKIKNS